MSILDSIKNAELNAEQNRIEANDNAKNLLEQTKISATRKAELLLNKGKEQENLIMQQTLVNVAKKESELNLAYEMEDQQIASHAEKKMDEVAAFILKKVVTQ
jgi:putative sterol carrier protein